MERILAVSLTALGDTLMSLPALASLRQAQPDAVIRYAVPMALQPLFADHPTLDGAMGIDLPTGKSIASLVKVLDLVAELRRFSPDSAFVFACNPDTVVPVLRAAGARKVYMVPNHGRFRRLLTNSRSSPADLIDIGEHGVEDRLRVVRAAGIDAAITPTDLPVPGSWAEEARSWLVEHGLLDRQLILFQVYTSVASEEPKPGELLQGTRRRHWPRERFAEVARALVQRFPQAVVVVSGSSQERQGCEEMVGSVSHPRVATSAGELSLPGVAGLLSMAKLLLTPDTGIMHLGHAVHVPSVCLYSLSDVHRTRRLDTDVPHKIVKQIPPDWPESSPEDIANCMSFITTEEVIDACTEVLNQVLKPLSP